MKMHQFNDKDFNLQLIEISEIQLIGEDDTIDICVQQDYVFFANNILTHNSSINQQLLLGDGISHSMMKLEIADFVRGFLEVSKISISPSQILNL